MEENPIYNSNKEDKVLINKLNKNVQCKTFKKILLKAPERPISVLSLMERCPLNFQKYVRLCS